MFRTLEYLCFMSTGRLVHGGCERYNHVPEPLKRRAYDVCGRSEYVAFCNTKRCLACLMLRMMYVSGNSRTPDQRESTMRHDVCKGIGLGQMCLES